MSYDQKLIVKVANLYYKDNLTQEEIAKKLKVSKYQVNRIIKRAVETGIVKITIVDPTESITTVEEELEKRFDLKRAIVVDNQGLSDIELKSKLGQAAAKYLSEIVKDGDVLGVAWGTTVNEVVKNMPNMLEKKVKVVQVTGGSHQLSVNLNCHDITRRFAKRFGVEPHLLYAPAVLDTKRLRDMLIKDSSIKGAFDLFDQVSIAVVGIGAIYPKLISTLVKTGHINEKDLKSLIAEGAIGDVFSHFFDAQGNPSDSDISDRIIAMSAKQLVNVPYSIGIAGGVLKAQAILGAIRGKFVNILVTDTTAARKIIKIA